MEARAILPPDEVPNPNDPVTAAPGTVGPPNVRPGDPDGVTLSGPDVPWSPLPRVVPSAWSGWPADWSTPAWGKVSTLTDVAWMCLDLNTSVLASMPPYLCNAAASLSADWMTNPNPDVYTSWDEFAKTLFWDYYMGEAFVLATTRYATGWPARFHVVPPWAVNVELDTGRRRYTIGRVDVTDDLLHVRYQSTVDDAHGHGPLEAGAPRMVASQVLGRYGMKLAAEGGIPSGILTSTANVNQEQALLIKQRWLEARLSAIGEPAVLSGGLTWTPTQVNPTQMALIELLAWNEVRIAELLRVPPVLVGLPSPSGSMTYENVNMYFDLHWRAGLRPVAQAVMSALSGWALPRGTSVELNRDEYIQPGPYERAQTAQILNGIVDPVTGRPALSVDEIRAAERLDNPEPAVAQGVLR